MKIKEKEKSRLVVFRHGTSILLLVLFILLFLGCGTTEGATKKEETAETYYERGNKLAEDEDWWGAYNEYTKAIERNPNFADAYFKRGFVNGGHLNDLEEAFADFNKAIELNPRVGGTYPNSAYLNRGIIYKIWGNAQAYTNIFGYSTNSVGTTDVSKLTKALEYFDRALPDLTRASESTAPDIQQMATANIAEVQKKKGEVEEALSASGTRINGYGQNRQ